MTRSLSLRGIPLEVHDAEDLSNAIVAKNDFWEADILDYLRDNHHDQGVVIDIGANIGNHSVYFAFFLDCREIIAYEPDPENFALLKWNLRYVKEAWPQQIAISDGYGCLYLHRNMSNWGAHEVNNEIGDELVMCIPLDLAWGDHNETENDPPVTLIKIDAEWHEPHVIAGAQKTISRYHPLILIEDVKREYGGLLPGYEIEQEWPHHNTYLYRWAGND